MIKKIISLIICITLISCSYRPIFQPNEKYRTVGEKVAQQDADFCMEESKEYLAAYKKRRALKEGTRKGFWGGIMGAVFGFLLTGDSVGLAKGIAVGAGTGAVSGAGGVMAEDKLKPDELKQRYTTSCLAGKGYQILGWE